MAHLSPKDLQPQEFTKTFRGYDSGEVDAYIKLLMDNYISMYNEFVQLETKLANAQERLKTIDEDEENAKKNLNIANEASKKIISDAYERADDILSSIRNNCDFILNSFKKKIDIQKEALLKIQDSVLQFKNNLFETYKSHIELIERISPVYELSMDEDTTPDQYVEHVIEKLKEEVASEYGMTKEEADSPTYATRSFNSTKDIDNALLYTQVFYANPDKDYSQTKPVGETGETKKKKIVDFTKPIPDSVIKERRIKENEDTKLLEYGDDEIDIDSMMARAVQPEREYVPIKEGKIIKSSESVVTLINRYEDKDVVDAPKNDEDIQLSFDLIDKIDDSNSSKGNE